MNTNRLLLLADFLDTVPEHKFNIVTWRNAPEENYGSGLLDDKLFDNECGTTACAVGWACSIPAFREQGLRWDDECVVYVHEGEFVRGCDPVGWSAVIDFFDVSLDVAYAMFDVTAYSGNTVPGDVSCRIREIVAAVEANPGYGSEEIQRDYPAQESEWPLASWHDVGELV